MQVNPASTQPNHCTTFHLSTTISTTLHSTSAPRATASNCHRQKLTWPLHWAKMLCKFRVT